MRFDFRSPKIYSFAKLKKNGVNPDEMALTSVNCQVNMIKDFNCHRPGLYLPYLRGQISAPFPMENSHIFFKLHVNFPN